MTEPPKPVKKTFQCSKCGKNFKERHHLENHNRRKTPCNVKHECTKCHKVFISKTSLKRHGDRVTACALEEIPVVTNDNLENKCHLCGKEFSTASNLKRHQKDVCNATNNPQLLSQLMTLVIQQQTKITNLESHIVGNPQTVINGNVNIQNNILNNNYVNVTICGFGKEDFSKLDKNKVLDLIKNHEKDFMPQMIGHVHANPDMPENHNVFFDSNRNKAIVYAAISEHENSWQAQDLEDVLRQITKKIKTYMKPGNSPYFDLVMKDRDYDTGNIIIRIADQTNWDTSEVFEKARTCLSQISKNKEFMNLVTIED